jgi:hypothetical protein
MHIYYSEGRAQYLAMHHSIDHGGPHREFALIYIVLDYHYSFCLQMDEQTVV